MKTLIVPCVFAATGILAVSALVLWPLSYLEGWNSKSPITVMITAWESTVTGHYGDPSMARTERGQLILDTWAKNLAAFLSRLKAGEVKQSLREGRMPPH